MENKQTSNPMEHTANVKKEFKTLIDHLRNDIEKINDPQGKALFEVSAEVLIGLEKAFTDYEEKKEPAWRK
jgi:predicted AlkP superfamily phosphohydrolase/phosphomutase